MPLNKVNKCHILHPNISVRLTNRQLCFLPDNTLIHTHTQNCTLFFQINVSSWPQVDRLFINLFSSNEDMNNLSSFEFPSLPFFNPKAPSGVYSWDYSNKVLYV